MPKGRAEKEAKRREAVADAVVRLRDALSAASPGKRWDAAEASALRDCIAARLGGSGGSGGDGDGDGADAGAQLRSLGVLLGFLLSPAPPAPSAPEREAAAGERAAAVTAPAPAPEQQQQLPPAKRRRQEQAPPAPPPPPPPAPSTAAAATTAALPTSSPPPPSSPLQAALCAFGVDEPVEVATAAAAAQSLWPVVCAALERCRQRQEPVSAPPAGVLALYSALATAAKGGLTLLRGSSPPPLGDEEADATTTTTATAGCLPCLWLPDQDPAEEQQGGDDDSTTSVPGRLYTWEQLCWTDPSGWMLEAMFAARGLCGTTKRRQKHKQQRSVERAWPALAARGLFAVAAVGGGLEEDCSDSDDGNGSGVIGSSDDEDDEDDETTSTTTSDDDDSDDDDGGPANGPLAAAAAAAPAPLRHSPSPRALCAAIAFAADRPGAVQAFLLRAQAPGGTAHADADAARWAAVSCVLAALGGVLARRPRDVHLPVWVRPLRRALLERHGLRTDNGGYWVSVSQRPYCSWPGAEAEAEAGRARRLLEREDGVNIVVPAAVAPGESGHEQQQYHACLALVACGVMPLALAAYPVVVVEEGAGAASASAATSGRGKPRLFTWPLAVGAISRALPALQAGLERHLGPKRSERMWSHELEPKLQRLSVCCYHGSSGSGEGGSGRPLAARLALPVSGGPAALSSAGSPFQTRAVLDGSRLILAPPAAASDAGGSEAAAAAGAAAASPGSPPPPPPPPPHLYRDAARELVRLALPQCSPPTFGAVALLLDHGAIAAELAAAIERGAAAAAAAGEGAAAGEVVEEEEEQEEQEAAPAQGLEAERARWSMPFAPLLPEPRTDGAGLTLPPERQQEQQQPDAAAALPTFSPYDPLRRAFTRPAASQAVAPLLAAPLPENGGGAVGEETVELPPQLKGRFRWQDTSAVARAAADRALREFLVGARVLRRANSDAALPRTAGAIPGAGGGGGLGGASKHNRNASTTARDRNAAVGRWGELVALHHLRDTLASSAGGGEARGAAATAPPAATEVTWCNAQSEAGLPYDLVIRPKGSTNESEWHYVEVKTSASPDKVLFEVSWREMAFAARKGGRFSVVRVFGAAGGGQGAGAGPVRLLHARDPVALWSQGALAVCMVV
jgi:hypothetical protein